MDSYDWDNADYIDVSHVSKKSPTTRATSSVCTLQDLFGDISNKVQDIAELFDISFEQAFLFFKTNNYKTPDFDDVPEYIYKEQFINSNSPCESAFCEDSEQFITYMCGHTFCGDCWKGYVMSQVNDGISCLNTTCMGEKCSEKCSPAFILSLLEDEQELSDKYKMYLINDYLQHSCMQDVRWCSAGCGAILAKEKCTCGAVTCMRCGEKDHKPIPCDLLKTWNKILSLTDANEAYIKSRTKPCPKCKTLIEKNEGCHHMTCMKCGHHWCWICHADWGKHGYGKPCKQETDEAINTEKDRVETNKFLVKVNFYFLKQKDAELKRAGLEKQCKLFHSNIAMNRIEQVIFHSKKLMDALGFLGKIMILFYFVPEGKNKDLLQTNVDFFQKMVVDTYKYVSEATQSMWEDDNNLYRKLQTDVKSIEGCQKNVSAFIESIDAELQYKCESMLDGWGCSVCDNINEYDKKVCKKCYACISHQEKHCVICKK